MAGSIALSSIAALRTGSGLVTAIVPDGILETVAGFHPAIMTIGSGDDLAKSFDALAVKQIAQVEIQFNAVAIGPGMGTGGGAVDVVKHYAAMKNLARVFDADALNTIAQEKLIAAPEIDFHNSVLTPHAGELARLTGVDAGRRDEQIDAAAELSIRCGAVIVVKGGSTVVVDGKQRWTNRTGNPGMATAGSGDVLTGMIASLLGQSMSPWDAARLAVHHHGLAGDRAAAKLGQAATTSLDIADEIRIDR